jgi:hypothetical protein
MCIRNTDSYIIRHVTSEQDSLSSRVLNIFKKHVANKKVGLSKSAFFAGAKP